MKALNTDIETWIKDVDHENQLILFTVGHWYWVKPGLWAQILEFFPVGRRVKAEIGPEQEVVALVGCDVK
jgi:hypothetical protein